MKLTYRPEIDGMRALAVVAVIFYHAQVLVNGLPVFAGGFVGVDVFFVISGYLITSLLLKELNQSGRISIRNFYERRARRILPALFTILIFSAILGWKYLVPTFFVDFAKSVIGTLFFGANFYFHYSGLEYGAANSILKPLLHMWSLSVEEQFYIFFPLFVFFLFKKQRTSILSNFFLLAVLSMLLSEWGSRHFSSANFYFLPSRMWELMAGAIMAKLEDMKGRRSNELVLGQIMPSIGLMMVLHSITTFHDGMLHPSLRTIEPVLGTCLIIWYANSEDIVTRILASRPFVSVGLISYSLYLWHYPLLSFANISSYIFDHKLAKLNVIVATFILSIATYYLIERPLRQKAKINTMTFTLVISFCFLLAIGLSAKVIEKKGFNVATRIPGIVLKNVTVDNVDLRQAVKDENGKPCHNNPKGCRFIFDKDKPHVFLIGDSHFAVLDSLVFEKVKLLGMNYHTYTIGGCFFIPDFHRASYVDENVKSPECNEDMQARVLEEIAKYNDSIIILGGRMPLYLSRKYFDNEEGARENSGTHPEFVSDKKLDLKKHFVNSVRTLLRKNKVILVYPIPEVGFDVPSRLLGRINVVPPDMSVSDYLRVAPLSTSYDVYKRRSEETFKLYDEIESPKMRRVYPDKLFCDRPIEGRCVVHDEKDFFYFDDDHPSKKGAEMIVELISKEIESLTTKD